MTAAEVRVLGWDHPRCTAPLAAAAAAYREIAPEVTVRIDARPLADFNDQPPWEVEGSYDLLLIDHPMVGAIAERRALLPFEELLGADALHEVAAGSLGPAYRSYRWAGSQWALPLDLATQVSARNTRKLSALGESTPRTWDDVLALAQREPGAVALPLTAADAMCTLISLSANARRSSGREPHWFDPEALRHLSDLVGLIRPAGVRVPPPRLLVELAEPSTPLSYVPFVFGYSLLHRDPVAFGNVPGRHGRPIGAILGGAGIGIPVGAARPAEAAAFAAWLMRGDVQRDLLLPAGAQTASRWCWSSATAREHDFFLATEATMSAAFTRPRDPWWPDLHRRGGELLLEHLLAGTNTDRIAGDLAELTAHISGMPATTLEEAI